MKYQKELDLLKSKVKPIYIEANKYVVLISTKGDQDIVTTTDFFIEDSLINEIKKTFPKDFFHSEEYHNKTKLKNRTWIIDPIDGTSNYASNLGLYVIQIALYDEQDIVLSYIYAPELNKTYYAVKGEGSFINDHHYVIPKTIRSSNFLISMVGITHTNEDKTFYEKLIDLSMEKKYKLRMLGSIGLELSLASEGIFNIFYTNVTNLWDLCPGLLLVREAGAILLNEKGEPYKLTDKNLFVCKDDAAKQILLHSILKG